MSLEVPGLLAPGERVVLLAQQFLGLVEKEANKRWDDPKTPGVEGDDDLLRSTLRNAGWEPGWPYCMAWAEGVWRLAGAPRNVLDLLNPSVVKSAVAFEKRGLISQEPTLGAILFLRLGDTGKGHAGIVARLHPGLPTVGTIEANTSADGKKLGVEAERQGDGIHRKTRPQTIRKSAKGLWTMGYLLPFPNL